MPDVHSSYKDIQRQALQDTLYVKGFRWYSSVNLKKGNLGYNTFIGIQKMTEVRQQG